MNTWTSSRRTRQRKRLASVTPEDALVGQTYYVFMHEAGHAMFAYFEAPVFGGEERRNSAGASFLAEFGHHDLVAPRGRDVELLRSTNGRPPQANVVAIRRTSSGVSASHFSTCRDFEVPIARRCQRRPGPSPQPTPYRHRGVTIWAKLRWNHVAFAALGS